MATKKTTAKPAAKEPAKPAAKKPDVIDAVAVEVAAPEADKPAKAAKAETADAKVTAPGKPADKPADNPADKPADRQASSAERSAPAAQQPSAAPPRRGNIGNALGAVSLAGVLALGAYIFVIAPSAAPTPPTAATDLTPIEARLDALDATIAALPMAEAAGTTVDLSPVTEALEALRDAQADQTLRLDDLAARLAVVDAAVAALPAGGVTVSEGDGEAARALMAEVEALRTRIAEDAAEGQARADRLAATAADAEARLAKLAANSARATRLAEGTIALSQIGTALETGAGFGRAADAMEKIGIELPASLSARAEAGVLTFGTLRRAFPDAARAALEADASSRVDGNSAQGFLAFLQSQVKTRSLEAQEGNGADAVLSRMAAALQEGDLDTTLAEGAGLSNAAAGAPEMAAWLDEARARAEAIAGHAALTQALHGER